jgi:hypothetical protein
MLGALAVPGGDVGWVLVPICRACVKGNAAGGRLLWEMGSSAGRGSTLPLCTKTRALGFATITRGGGVMSLPEGDFNSSAAEGSTTTAGRGGGTTACIGGGATGMAWEGDFGGKRGVVFEAAGAPVSRGAIGFAGAWAGGAFAMLGIGLVTAVDQAGGVLAAGTGSIWPGARMGIVVAAETLGRGVGTIFAEAGLSGRGGRLMRSVSRLGALGSGLLSGVAGSAIICPFYSYFGKCSIAKLRSPYLSV